MITKTGVDIIASAQLILDKVEKMKILAANAQNPFAGYRLPDLVLTIKSKPS